MKKKYVILAFCLGFLFACVSLGVNNFYGGSSTKPTITCSADGKYVYIVDIRHLFKSADFGESFKKVAVVDIATE